MLPWIIRLLIIAIFLAMTRATRHKVSGWIRWPIFAFLTLAIVIQGGWSHFINLMMPFETRPGKIAY